MKLTDFIRQHKTEIDNIIQDACPGALINNNERELWILNDEGLYNWAQSEGVDI